MAALMEHVAFCQLSNESELLAVTESDEDDAVTVCCKTKGITVYKVDSQKPVKSWSVRRGVTLTSPVLWNKSRQEYITIVNSQEVRHWGTDTTDFDKARKKNVGFKTKQLFVVPEFEPIVVCVNGAVGFLKGLKDSQGASPLMEGESVVWCQARRLLDSLCVICAVTSKAGSCVVTHVFNKATDQWQMTRCPVAGPGAGADLLDCAWQTVDNSTTLYILWSSGILQAFTVSSDGQLSSVTSQHSFPGIHGNSSMVVMDTAHVAVAGVVKDGNDGLAVFDTKFGSEQGWKALPGKFNKKAKVFCVGGHLFTVCDKTLYSYKYSCEPSTIASLLGRLSTPVSSDSHAPDHYTWSAKNQINKRSHQSDKIVALFDNALKSNQSYKQFKVSFNTLMDAIHKDSAGDWSVSSHMTQLVQQCLTEKRFWPQLELTQLIKHKFIPQRLLNALFDGLVQHCEVALLYTALSTLNDIPEKSLCKTLEFFLQCEEETLCNAVDDLPADNVLQEDERSPVTSHRAFFINHVLSLPYSDVFVLECLRSVSFKHTLKLLEYLCHHLETTFTEGQYKKTEPGKTNILSLPQVVEWLLLVLDAHMTQLVLSPDAHVMIVNLHNIITSQVQFYDELISLEALLDQLKAQSLVKQNHIGQYCIEMLHIP